jgi:hypothetical protein
VIAILEEENRMLKGKVMHLSVRLVRLESNYPAPCFALDSAGNIYTM